MSKPITCSAGTPTKSHRSANLPRASNRARSHVAEHLSLPRIPVHYLRCAIQPNTPRPIRNVDGEMRVIKHGAPSSSSSVRVVMNCGRLPYSQRPPQDPNSRYETKRPYNGETRCGQVDDGGQNDFAAPLQRAAGRDVGVLQCRVPHVHSVSSFSVMVLVVVRGICPV